MLPTTFLWESEITIECLLKLWLGRCWDDVASESGKRHFGAAEGFEAWDAEKVDEIRWNVC